MLAHFVRKARSGVSHFSRRALMSVLSGVTQVEQRALLSAAEGARIGRVCMVEEGLAAALGAGVRIGDSHASAVVDIGGATTNVAVVANGLIVNARAERIGSWNINAAIIDHVRRHRGLVIGAQTGSPGAIEITAGELYPIAHEVVRKIVEVISTTLTELPAEVASDIYDRGLVLTGGGAQFSGLDDYLRDQTRLPVRIADEPKYAIVRGLEQMFNEPLWVRRVMRCGPQPMLDLERDIPGFET
jgi:rod shape-determining protein MreB